MTPEHEFAIPVRDLDAGGKSFDFPVRAAWLRKVIEGTQVEPTGPDGHLALRLSKSGADVVVRGTMHAELSVPCARCLEPAKVVVDEPVSALAMPSSAMRETHAAPPKHDKSADDDEDDLPPDQDDVIPYDGETVVLDDLVRDELLLGIPMIPLCSESCAGISPRSDEPPAEASIDPRLRPLLRLKNRQPE